MRSVYNWSLITRLSITGLAKQCWCAGDATGSGSANDVRQWGDELEENGPGLGYVPNAKKCWLIVKACKEEATRELFAGTASNVTTEGHEHLEAALGPRSHLKEYVNER